MAILKIYGEGSVPVERLAEYFADLNHAYQSIEYFLRVTEQIGEIHGSFSVSDQRKYLSDESIGHIYLAEYIDNYYEEESLKSRPGRYLTLLLSRFTVLKKRLSTTSPRPQLSGSEWWSDSPYARVHQEAIRYLHDPTRRPLSMRSASFASPGVWEFLGDLNPAEVLRKFLNDKHARSQDSEFRNDAEKRRLALENMLLENKVIRERLEILDNLPEAQKAELIRDWLEIPLARLSTHQPDTINSAEVEHTSNYGGSDV